MASSKWKPSEGNWGVFGSAKGSKAGTLRRAQKDGALRNVETAGGDFVSESGNRIRSSADAKGIFSNRWESKTAQEVSEVQSTLGKQDLSGTSLEGTALDNNIMLPKSMNLAETLTSMEKGKEEAELNQQLAFAEARQLEVDAVTIENKAKEDYSSNMSKVSRDQAGSLQAGARQQGQAAAAGSQSGFAKSGAIERLREMGENTQQTSLANIAEQKKMITEARDTGLSEAETNRAEAITGRETATSAFEGSMASYDLEMKNLLNPLTGGGIGDSIQLVEDEMKAISSTDRALQSSISSYGGYGGSFWKDANKRADYGTLKGDIETARTAINELGNTGGE